MAEGYENSFDLIQKCIQHPVQYCEKQNHNKDRIDVRWKKDSYGLLL